MKKLLSLVLVLAMVLGLTVPAFAEDFLTEVNFTLSEYVDENTAMTITVPAEEAESFSEISFGGFYCVSGDSAYIRNYNQGNGFTPAGFEDWENPLTEELETPELDGSTLFAMFELTTVKKYLIKEGNTVVKNGGNVVPSLSDYIGFFDDDVSHYEDEATYEAAGEAYLSKYTSFLLCPADTFWNFNETSLTVFVKLFGSAPNSGTATIKAIKEEPELAYSIVIPQAVTDLTEENHMDVLLGGETGKVSINVTTDNAKTKVYYTVDLENATLTNGTNNITTSYTYAQGGDYSELKADTKVTVYENETVKPSTIKVSADNDEWTNAPSGEYSATLTFNFVAKELICDVDLTEYKSALVVEKIDDSQVTYDLYMFDEGVLTSKMGDRIAMNKGKFEGLIRTEYAVGDCFHIKGTDFVKCTALEAHELDYEKVVFIVSVDNEDGTLVVPVGTTYRISEGYLYIGDMETPLDTGSLEWTLDGVVLTNGKTGTITNNGYFKGILYQ